MAAGTRNWKKEKSDREMSQLKVFQESFAELASATITLNPDDPPDGFATLGSNIIGIELTEILWDPDHHGLNKKGQLSMGDQIIRFAQDKYESRNLPPIHVWITFVNHFGLRTYGEPIYLSAADKRNLSDYLVDIISKNVPSKFDTLMELPEFDDQGEPMLHEKIESIAIERFANYHENFWTSDGGGMIPRISYEKLNNAIAQKNKAVGRYALQMDEKWLVIVEYWDDIAGNFSFRDADAVLSAPHLSPFDRIFILRSRLREVIELVVCS